ncbi:MAG TPA: CehA/McbA family metallohydrolase [Kofleriaceae bacterium]|nr:CehA/McbA family metallohydrolase [Kofleriaceae bacterium]
MASGSRRAAAVLAACATCLQVAGTCAIAIAGAGCKRRAPAQVGGTVTITVTDGVGGPPVPARVLLWDGDEPVRWGKNELYGGVRQAKGACEPAPGVLGTWNGLVLANGQGTIPFGSVGGTCEPLPPGRYRVWAWRGFEHERWEGEVTLQAGGTSLTIPLERAWTAEGALAADMHVHAASSNDSGLPDQWRVMAQAAAGIQVIVLSDHAVNGDLDAAIAELGLGEMVASVASNEAGNDLMHLGVYPVTVDGTAPRGGSPTAAEMATWTPAQMMTWGRSVAGIVQVNHPRFRMYSLFDAARWNGVAWPPPFPLDFDAVEVLAGHTSFNAPGDRRIDEGVRDFYTLASHGARVAGVGGSDTHHLNGVLDGVARTYVLVDVPRLAPFDEARFIAAIRGRRAVATTGPWLDVEVVDVAGGTSAGPGEELVSPTRKVRIDIELSQARWVHTTRVRVLVGGTVMREEPVPAGARRHRVVMEVDVTGSTWIGVDAGGDDPLPVEMTGTYQQEKGRPGVVPFAVINPIWIEVPAGEGAVTVPPTAAVP